jgi:hypothetical protein
MPGVRGAFEKADSAWRGGVQWAMVRGPLLMRSASGAGLNDQAYQHKPAPRPIAAPPLCCFLKKRDRLLVVALAFGFAGART